MKKIISTVLFAALALFANADVGPNTEWQDVPPDTTLGKVTTNVVTKEYVESLGIGGGVDTNAVKDITRPMIADAANSATNHTDSVADELREEIEHVAPGNYAAVSNAAMTALRIIDLYNNEWDPNFVRPYEVGEYVVFSNKIYQASRESSGKRPDLYPEYWNEKLVSDVVWTKDSVLVNGESADGYRVYYRDSATEITGKGIKFTYEGNGPMIGEQGLYLYDGDDPVWWPNYTDVEKARERSEWNVASFALAQNTVDPDELVAVSNVLRNVADSAQAHSEATRAMISAIDPTFSNAVLAVGLNGKINRTNGTAYESIKVTGDPQDDRTWNPSSVRISAGYDSSGSIVVSKGYGPMAGESGEIIVTSQDEQFNDHTLVVHGDGITVDNVPLVRKSYVDASISTNNPAFVSAVLDVQVTSLSTNITTEIYVAATNACANLGIDPELIPGEGTVGTVGGIIAMLFAVVFWMRKKIFDNSGKVNDTFAGELLGKQVANVKANTVSLAAAYSETATYAVGDAVTYNGKLYKCAVAITTAEAWTPAHWTETTVATLWNNADTTSYGGQN